MGIADWLVVASLGVSLFAVLSAIGLARKLNETQTMVDLLVFKAQLDVRIRQLQEEEQSGAQRRDQGTE